jgi:hypothetical protein
MRWCSWSTPAPRACRPLGRRTPSAAAPPDPNRRWIRHETAAWVAMLARACNAGLLTGMGHRGRGLRPEFDHSVRGQRLHVAGAGMTRAPRLRRSPMPVRSPRRNSTSTARWSTCPPMRTDRPGSSPAPRSCLACPACRTVTCARTSGTSSRSPPAEREVTPAPTSRKHRTAAGTGHGDAPDLLPRRDGHQSFSSRPPTRRSGETAAPTSPAVLEAPGAGEEANTAPFGCCGSPVRRLNG